MEQPRDLWGGVPLVVVEVNHISVLCRQGQDGLQHFLVLLGDRGGQIRRCLQGHGPAAEDAFQQIFAGVEGDPDEPGLLVLSVGERGRVEGVLEENGLKDVLGVRIVFQMQHAQPPDGVGVPVDGGVDLLFTPHGVLSLLMMAQQPWCPPQWWPV